MKKLIPLVVLFTTAIISSVFASEKIETNRFETLADKATEMVEKYGVENVLVAYDMDETLVVPHQYLGSSPWFSWQVGLLKKKDHPLRIAKDFNELLKISDLTLSLSKTKLVEPSVKTIVEDLQQKGVASIIVTSRNYNKTNGTLHHLKNNNLDFTRTALPTNYSGLYLPWDPENPEASGLTHAEVEKFRLKSVRPVLYMEGVYFTNGLHKGAAIKTLLKKLNRSFKAIIFIDDQQKHVDRVYNVLDAMDVDVTSIRYGGADPFVEKFKNSEELQRKCVQRYKLLNWTLNHVFPAE